jgi:four helix bundle protein
MTKDTDKSGERRYDLEERTALFGERIIEFCQLIAVAPTTAPLISQLVRAGTSIGANYSEADDAESRADFRHKIAICKKEARETKFWLRMMVKAAPECRKPARELWREAKELHLIFVAVHRKVTDRKVPPAP